MKKEKIIDNLRCDLYYDITLVIAIGIAYWFNVISLIEELSKLHSSFF